LHEFHDCAFLGIRQVQIAELLTLAPTCGETTRFI